MLKLSPSCFKATSSWRRWWGKSLPSLNCIQAKLIWPITLSYFPSMYFSRHILFNFSVRMESCIFIKPYDTYHDGKKRIVTLPSGNQLVKLSRTNNFTFFHGKSRVLKLGHLDASKNILPVVVAVVVVIVVVVVVVFISWKLLPTTDTRSSHVTIKFPAFSDFLR